MSELALQLIAEAKRTGAKSLDLGRCGLYEWPKELFELEHLEELVMSNRVWDYEKQKWRESENTGAYNLLREIPPEIAQLKHLQKLIIGGSGAINDALNYFRIFWDYWSITDISVLQGLSQLQTLDLSFCKQIQEHFSVLQGLQGPEPATDALPLRYFRTSRTKLQRLIRSNNISDTSPYFKD